MVPPLSHIHKDESPESASPGLVLYSMWVNVSQCISLCLTAGLSDSMGPEISIDSILALEKQVEEGTGDVIQLKRTRNSLLNISARVPPEILGHSFR